MEINVRLLDTHSPSILLKLPYNRTYPTSIPDASAIQLVPAYVMKHYHKFLHCYQHKALDHIFIIIFLEKK